MQKCPPPHTHTLPPTLLPGIGWLWLAPGWLIPRLTTQFECSLQCCLRKQRGHRLESFRIISTMYNNHIGKRREFSVCQCADWKGTLARLIKFKQHYSLSHQTIFIFHPLPLPVFTIFFGLFGKLTFGLHTFIYMYHLETEYIYEQPFV